jgi:uncharacterized protein YabE (DUF348 family)
MKNCSLKFKITIFFIIATGFNPVVLNSCNAKDDNINFYLVEKVVTLKDDGLIFNIKTQTQNVSDFLEKQKINLKNDDFVFPDRNFKIYSGSVVTIQRAKNISIIDGKNKIAGLAFGNNTASALWENKISLGEDDIITPDINTPLSDNTKIEIIRVDVKEEAITKDIDFKKISEEDDDLSWRKTSVKQKGVKGKEEIKYRIVSHNGKEISRKIIERNVVTNPIPEIIVQGTYVKLGKSHSGGASWYSFTGGLTAANPWLPMGSFVKVTNKGNGKSVIVKIVDRGPWGPGRIIDLEKVAFAKIANIGEGVVNVKMEEIIN